MSPATDKPISRWLNKVPEITLAFWIIKNHVHHRR
jgi:uncharacterized membrane-anchored protein